MSVEDRITAAIADAIAAGEMGADHTEGMPGSWVLVSMHYDAQGERRAAVMANDEAHLHETLGLLHLGTAVYEEQGRNWVMGLSDE